MLGSCLFVRSSVSLSLSLACGGVEDCFGYERVWRRVCDGRASSNCSLFSHNKKTKIIKINIITTRNNDLSFIYYYCVYYLLSVHHGVANAA